MVIIYIREPSSLWWNSSGNCISAFEQLTRFRGPMPVKTLCNWQKNTSFGRFGLRRRRQSEPLSLSRTLAINLLGVRARHIVRLVAQLFVCCVGSTCAVSLPLPLSPEQRADIEGLEIEFDTELHSLFSIVAPASSSFDLRINLSAHTISGGV